MALITTIYQLSSGYNLPSAVFACSSAIIDQSHLAWAKLEELKTFFPGRMKIEGSNAILTGPVAILSSSEGAKALQAYCSKLRKIFIITSVMGVLVSIASLLPLSRIHPRHGETKRGVAYSAMLYFTAFALAAVAGIIFGRLGSLLPTEPGIYFYQFSGLTPSRVLPLSS